MKKYIFNGVVLPQRAMLTYEMPEILIRFENRNEWRLSLSIILNQIIVIIDSDEEDIFTLRNMVQDFIGGQISVLSFTHGHSYDVELTRVITVDRQVNHVFGIDIPCIRDKNSGPSFYTSPEILGLLLLTDHGYLLQRFFTDFSLAMKHPMDTGFYCYRAIESLRQHAAITNNPTISSDNDNRGPQWERFRRLSSTSKEQIKPIAESAKPVRHGGNSRITDDERRQLFETTWDIAKRYLVKVCEKPDIASQLPARNI